LNKLFNKEKHVAVQNPAVLTVKSSVLNRHCSVFIWSQSIESKSNTLKQLCS